MKGAALDRVFRAASGRIVAALAARFRDLDLAEEAFAEACLRASRRWPESGVPGDPAAWLYRVAQRAAIDALRRSSVRHAFAVSEGADDPAQEEADRMEASPIPDERLRLIFIACHPALAVEVRAALTLRLICGLTVTEIARAFLQREATVAQWLVRAKRKIARAGVPFGLPAPAAWPERVEAVLITLEVAYSKAHEDAAGTGPHASFAGEMLALTRLVAQLVANTEGAADAQALAALVHYAEARRPARVRAGGAMVPLAEQDPRTFRRELIAIADRMLADAERAAPQSERTIRAGLQALWCRRSSPTDPPPWRQILSQYDRLLAVRDDPIVRINRVVALAEVAGPLAALSEVLALDSKLLAGYAPYWATRADLERRAGDPKAAAQSYRHAIALTPEGVEQQWLQARLAELSEV